MAQEVDSTPLATPPQAVESSVGATVEVTSGGGSLAIALVSSVIVLLLASASGWALYRWRLLVSREDAFEAAAAESPEAQLRYRLEAAMLLGAGMCVWVSMSLGAASARTLFVISPEQEHTARGVALFSWGAYVGAAIAAGFCLLAMPGVFGALRSRARGWGVPAGFGLFVLCFPVVYGVGHVAMLVSWLFAWLTSGSAPDAVAHDTLRTLVSEGGLGNLAWWMAVLAVVVGAPIAEEFVYRGCLQTALSRLITGGMGLGLRGWAPVIGTSVIFTLAHAGVAEPRALATLFALSLAFGAAYRRTGSLATPIVMHSLFNALNVGLAVWQS